MSRLGYIAFYFIVIGVSCNTEQDVEPAERTTFIKFFGNSNENIGAGLIDASDGYILLSSSIMGDSSQSMTLVKTSYNGNVLWEQKFEGAEAFDLLQVDDGYLILGDSIKPIDESESVSSIYLLKTDFEGNLLNSITISDPTDNELDYHGVALTSTANGDIIVIGTREDLEDNDEAILVGISAEFNLKWQQVYSQDNRNYIIGSSIYSNSSNQLFWAATSTSFSSDDNELTDAFISLPVVGVNSENINNSSYGNIEPGSYFASDIYLDNTGIGLVGYTNANGNNDIFFIKASTSGFFQETTATIISSTLTGIPLTGSDLGLAITRSRDGGYVLAASISTTPEIGNGERDLYLLKLNAFGEPIWENIIGGSGSEIASEIIQTNDGGYLIFGTQVFQNASMSMLIKTNNRGRLVE